MRKLVMCALLAAAPLSACTTYGDGYGYRDRYGYGPRGDWAAEYREGTYEPYALGANDYVYRGQDGRYYCRRHDGTVGLVIGAGVGALLGDAIAPRGSKTLGAILGGAAGGAVGYSADRDVRCQ
jgi:hypothetical protein